MSGFMREVRKAGFLAGFAAALTVPSWEAAAQDRASDRAWNDCIFSEEVAPRVAACGAVLARGAKETPRNRAVALHNRSLAYIQQQEYDRAIKDAEEAIGLDPKNALSFFIRATAYRNKGELDRAIEDFTESIKLNPSYARARYSRGGAYAEKGRLDEAIADYSDAIRLDPNYAPAWYGRGNAHYDKNNLDAAIADYDEAIRLDPLDALVFHSRGLAWYGKGDYDRAVADYTESIRHDPQNMHGYVNRGYAYMGKREFERAIADFTEVLRIAPNDALAVYSRALAWLHKGDYGRAVTDFSSSLALDPTDPDAYLNRGEAYASLGDHQRALADFEAALKIDPTLDHARRLSLRSRAALGEAPIREEAAVGTAAIAGRTRKLGLVIGIDTYKNVEPLRAAVNDARAIATGLKSIGFSVLTAENVDYAGMSARLVEFEQRIEPGDTVFFFFSGHGVAINGRNYLLPSDIRHVLDGQEAMFEYASFTADKILERVKGRGARAVVLVLDACRENPFPPLLAARALTNGGLKRIDPPEGVFVLFSAAADQVALDRLGPDDTHPNSVFTRVFAEEFVKPGITMVEIAKITQERVRDLARKAGRDQRPAYYDEIVGRFSLR